MRKNIPILWMRRLRLPKITPKTWILGPEPMLSPVAHRFKTTQPGRTLTEGKLTPYLVCFSTYSSYGLERGIRPVKTFTVATGGDSWDLGANMGTISCSWKGGATPGLTEWHRVKNEFAKQQQHLRHRFCTRRSTGFINGAAARAVFV